jgi:hypothetical protein
MADPASLSNAPIKEASGAERPGKIYLCSGVPVALPCNPSYSGGKDQIRRFEVQSQFRQIVLKALSQKKKLHKKKKGKGRVNISVHLWGTDRRFRFKERKN